MKLNYGGNSFFIPLNFLQLNWFLVILAVQTSVLVKLKIVLTCHQFCNKFSVMYAEDTSLNVKDLQVCQNDFPLADLQTPHEICGSNVL